MLDLTGLTHFDSAAANLLLDLTERLAVRGQALRTVVREGTPGARVLALTRLDTRIPTHRALDDAVGPCQAGP